jgi:hypothetical protein
MNDRKRREPECAPAESKAPDLVIDSRLLVTAPPGRVCPMELSRGRVGQTPVRVPNTVYYRRLILEGSLLLKQE